MKSLHISLKCLNITNSGCRPSNFMSFLTHSPQVFLSLSLHFTPSPLHTSTGPHPIIYILMLQMPKPSQSATPHHRTLNTQKTRKILVPLSILQRHSTHPPHHHMLCLLIKHADFQPEYSYQLYIWFNLNLSARLIGQDFPPSISYNRNQYYFLTFLRCNASKSFTNPFYIHD